MASELDKLIERQKQVEVELELHAKRGDMSSADYNKKSNLWHNLDVLIREREKESFKFKLGDKVRYHFDGTIYTGVITDIEGVNNPYWVELDNSNSAVWTNDDYLEILESTADMEVLHTWLSE
jgi:hypothetical protein